MSVLELIPHYHAVTQNEMIYSIDSFRATFSLNPQIAARIAENYEYLDNLFSCVVIKSEPEIAYRKLSFEAEYHDEYGKKLIAHVGIFINEDESVNGFIHFNPNRLFQSKKAIQEITAFFQQCDSVIIKLCDVAIDFAYALHDLTVVKGRKKMQQLIASSSSQTIYFGQAHKAGFAKLYSKSAKNKLPENVTRLELTLGNPEQADWYRTLLLAIPAIYRHGNSTASSETCRLTNAETVIMNLAPYFTGTLESRNVFLRNLENIKDKTHRKKLKEQFLSGSELMEFDVAAINQVVETVCSEIIGRQIQIRA